MGLISILHRPYMNLVVSRVAAEPFDENNPAIVIDSHQKPVGVTLTENLLYAWNSEASGKRSLHLARERVRSSSILVSSQLRAIASSLTRR
jgi:hypothetical protein